MEKVSSGYGTAPVIQEIDLQLEPGETSVIIGPNGHGKTTFLRTISGLIRPQSGRIMFEGLEIQKRSPEEITSRGIIHVPQGDHMFADLTVLENLLMGAFPRSAWRNRRSALERVFQLFPTLRERQKQRTRTLSGGERRQVALGRGLMRKPKVLIIDEPSLGLAPVIIRTVYEAIHQLASEGSTAILLAEENFNHIGDLADSVSVLELGRIIVTGGPAELTGDRRIAEAYLGALE